MNIIENLGIIYKVINNKTDEIYIGATTKSLNERKLDHLQKASKGIGSYFQEAIGTYGSDAFTWEQIDTASNINELAQKEIDSVFKYNSFQSGFNQNKGGGGFKKLVYQYDLKTGDIINIFDDLTSAGASVNASKKSISNVCLKIDKTCKGYYWSYSKDDFSHILDERTKRVDKYSLGGEYLASYNSVAEASIASGLSKTCISRCARGERENSGGFFWKYN
ncbi:MAG: NUMOD1 domain-containing DNA-binding protein [Bacteroidota bacterium]